MEGEILSMDIIKSCLDGKSEPKRKNTQTTPSIMPSQTGGETSRVEANVRSIRLEHNDIVPAGNSDIDEQDKCKCSDYGTVMRRVTYALLIIISVESILLLVGLVFNFKCKGKSFKSIDKILGTTILAGLGTTAVSAGVFCFMKYLEEQLTIGNEDAEQKNRNGLFIAGIVCLCVLSAAPIALIVWKPYLVDIGICKSIM